MIGIYKITSPSKKIYIGQSVNIENRFKAYKRLDCKTQPIIYNSLLKYGFEKHKFEILCECDIQELNDKERYYQDIFSATGKNGLNCTLTKSSDRSGKHSKETILKRIKSNTGKKRSKETKNKIGDAHRGKIVSKETRVKMSISAKNKKPMSKKTKLKMSESSNKIILNTETGIFYLGSIEAANSIGINRNTLINYLNGHRKNKTHFIYC